MNAVEDNPAPLRSPVTGRNVRLPGFSADSSEDWWVLERRELRR
jgi:hypothetical protein